MSLRIPSYQTPAPVYANVISSSNNSVQLQEPAPLLKTRRKRCPNGTRRNRKTGNCEPYSRKRRSPVQRRQQSYAVLIPEPVQESDHNYKYASQQYRSPRHPRQYTAKVLNDDDLEAIRETGFTVDQFNALLRDPVKYNRDSQRKRYLAAKNNIAKKFEEAEFQRRNIALLKMLCNDQNECISMGRETGRVNNLFKFRNFKYVTGIKPLSKGDNGEVYQLIYKIEVASQSVEPMMYESNAVLKHSIRAGSDSGFYEYLVGKKINEWMKYFPCFVETYGCYYSRLNEADPNEYSDALMSASSSLTPKERLSSVLTPIAERPNIEDVLRRTCQSPADGLTVDVLIQYLGNGIEYSNDNTFAIYVGVVHPPMITCLYQIYFCLAALRKQFTHYDLHPGNIMGYPLSNDGSRYVEMHYYTERGEEVVFCTTILWKIIDYGRCYVAGLSEDMRNYTCTICGKGCGECGGKCGYGTLAVNKATAANNYICSWKKNESHDMRILRFLKDVIITPEKNKYLSNFVPNIIKVREEFPELTELVKRVKYSGNTGTPERVGGGEGKTRTKAKSSIENVADVENYLAQVLLSEKWRTMSGVGYPANTEAKKVGEIHVYANVNEAREMRCIWY